MDIKELERLAPTADEMLSGLHADETMKRRILSAAREEKKRSVSMPHLVPALCCAALAVACIGMFAPRLSQTAVNAAASPAPVSIDTIAAGDSHNDLGMIRASKAGFLFRSPDSIKAENPDLPAFEEYDDLLAAVKQAMA